MKLFSSIKEWFYETLNIFRQIGLDKNYEKIFIKTITEECADRQSEFVKMNLKVGDDGKSIVYLTKIPDEFQNSGHDFMIYDKLNENTYFITEFLKKRAGFNNYVSSIPEYYHVEDPTANDVSLTYLAVWRFVPMVDGNQMFRTFTTVSLIALGVIGLTTAGVLFLV